MFLINIHNMLNCSLNVATVFYYILKELRMKTIFSVNVVVIFDTKTI
jgi:hypothetical protein